MRWLLLFFTGLALVLSACGKIGNGERIAVVNWEKVLQEHPQYVRLQNLKDEYNRLLDKRREQEIISKTRMSSLAKLYQLKRNSKQSFLSAEFLTRMTEQQTAEQEKLKQLSNQIADQVDRELAEEEKKMNEYYRLQIFNLRLKLDTVRMVQEERKKLEAELKTVQAARDRDRMLLIQHKIGLVNQRMEPHVNAMRQRLDAYARQLQEQMMADMAKGAEKDRSLLEKAPAALKELLGTVDQELDKRQQDMEALEMSMKKDMESLVIKLAKERGYSVVFHKYRTNVSADDITGEVISGLKKLEARAKAADALNKKGRARVHGRREVSRRRVSRQRLPLRVQPERLDLDRGPGDRLPDLVSLARLARRRHRRIRRGHHALPQHLRPPRQGEGVRVGERHGRDQEVSLPAPLGEHGEGDRRRERVHRLGDDGPGRRDDRLPHGPRPLAEERHARAGEGRRRPPRPLGAAVTPLDFRPVLW